MEQDPKPLYNGPAYREYLDRIGRIRADPRLSDEEFDSIESMIIEKSNYLIEKYPDAKKRILYHALVGSGFYESEEMIDQDFPGEDSLSKFLEELDAKFGRV